MCWATVLNNLYTNWLINCKIKVRGIFSLMILYMFTSMYLWHQLIIWVIATLYISWSQNLIAINLDTNTVFHVNHRKWYQMLYHTEGNVIFDLSSHLLHIFSSTFLCALINFPLPPPPFAAAPLPHCSFTVSLFCLFANFPFVLFFSLLPFLPASHSTPLWTRPCVCGPRGLSLGRWFDLWLGKCFEECWEGPGAWTRGLYLDLLSTQKIGETAAPLMLRYLNWQSSPAFMVWCISPSTYIGYTDTLKMAQHSEIRGYGSGPALWYCVLPPSPIHHDQSQLCPLSIHFINKHNCPGVHAQLFIMRVSQTQSFVTDLIWNFWGGAHDGEIYFLWRRQTAQKK